MLKVFTDSDSDITLEIAKKYGCELISYPYEVHGELIYPYRDFEVFDDKKYFEMLRSGVLPTTSALNEAEFTSYFEPAFADGNDVLYIHYSRSMSASFDNMDNAVKVLLKKYPDRKFYEIDTKAMTLGSLAVTIEALEMLKAGKTVDEVVEWSKKEVPHFATYFFADDLKFFRKSGRVSGLAGIMGNLIGIKPIIYMDDNGVLTNIGKVKGTKNAIKVLFDYFDKLKVDDFTKYTVYLGHGDSPELVQRLKEMIVEKYGDKINFFISPVNPTAGAHCGPDTIGITFHAIHR